jgi:two-component system, NtrC family, response regulator HydG
MAKKQAPVIMIVDDDAVHRMMLTTLLSEWGYCVQDVSDGASALALIRAQPVDVILMDMRMSGMDGIEATRLIRRHNPAIPILIMTAYSSIATAVEALKSGASDYLTKPIDFDALRLVLDRSLEHTRLQDENEALKQQLKQFQRPEIVGNSPAMRKMVEMISLVASSEATVLITGESGTGKSLVARALHAHSNRAGKPLVEINCAAIPETLIESELFGHERGAFTGADRQRRGRFSLADTGSIFLDEVGELPPSMQAKLLRILQDGEIQRVGSDTAIPVDVRVLAATNRDLKSMVEERTFREDLFYRLNVVAIEVPPLRERLEDIPLLAQHFARIFAEKNRKMVKGFTPQAMDLLLKHAWPGNIRELENSIERAVILLQGEYISIRELPLGIQSLSEQSEGTAKGWAILPGANQDGTLKDLEKQLILQVLDECGGNKSEAARRLGITRRTLKLKLKKYAEEDDG